MRNSFVRRSKTAIAVIVPAYNEALNISVVLGALRKASFLDEIIMVDDGSTDHTVEVLRQAASLDPRIRIILHDGNLGKGQAIFSGWAATSAPVILLLDADLKNLKVCHLRALASPVLERRADMTLGLFRGGHLSTDLSHWLTPFLSGQRCLRAELLKHVSREAAAGYGFEVALTLAAAQRNCRVQTVALDGVWHPPSEFRSERGYWYGRLWRFRMYAQIIRAWCVAMLERHPKTRAFLSSASKL